MLPSCNQCKYPKLYTQYDPEQKGVKDTNAAGQVFLLREEKYARPSFCSNSVMKRQTSGYFFPHHGGQVPRWAQSPPNLRAAGRPRSAVLISGRASIDSHF